MASLVAADECHLSSTRNMPARHCHCDPMPAWLPLQAASVLGVEAFSEYTAMLQEALQVRGQFLQRVLRRGVECRAFLAPAKDQELLRAAGGSSGSYCGLRVFTVPSSLYLAVLGQHRSVESDMLCYARKACKIADGLSGCKRAINNMKALGSSEHLTLGFAHSTHSAYAT